MTSPLPVARFAFSSDGAAEGAWAVVSFRGREGLSELYTCTVDVVHDEFDADPWTLLGRPATLSLFRGGLSRKLHGIAHRVERLGVVTGRVVARVHLAPALFALSQRVDSRIFQRMSPAKILARVLGDALLPYGRTVRLALDRTPAEREYCVQYRESDLDFARRLMEEEGIWWYFDHGGDEEVLVLTDNTAGSPRVETADGGPVVVLGPEADTAALESIRHLEAHAALESTSVVARDFDWTQPTLDLTRASRGADAQGLDREVYDHPAGLTIGPYDAGAKQYTDDDGVDRARVTREGFAAQTLVWEGDGYVTGFAAGSVVTIDEHRDGSANGDRLLTRVELRGENRDELRNERGGGRARHVYDNRFACTAADLPWRSPHRTARPVIEGEHTATVVGPAGEEIYTDEHGRIKVQFHWDRVGTFNERSSCFVRVSQAWAGTGWGFVFIPRIGMEVVVSFLEGDPDRPLVTGCVYNGANTPPYTLPDEKTRSTVKTNSSPGGGGFNEVRFEDMAGSEELFIHAQKDFNEVVEHDHSTLVHNNQRNTVDVNHSESVGGDQSLTVSGNRTKTVEKKETNTVNGERHTTVKPLDKLTVNGTMSTTVAGAETVKVSVDQTVRIVNHRTTTVTVNDSLRVGANKTDTIRGEYIVVGGPKVQLNQGGTSLTFEGGHAALSAASYIEFKHGSGSIRIEDSGKVKIVAGPELIAGTSGAGFQLKDGKIVVAATAIQMIGGGGAVSIDASGVTMVGAMIKSEAQGDNEIAAPIVVII